MDDTDPLIAFDNKGICSHCKTYAVRKKMFVPYGAERQKAIDKMVSFCKSAGSGKEYDCVIGVSGGVDSTYVAFLVKKLGLRPLAVHLDNGWNSELAVSNIKNVLNKLGIELFTYVLDWEEFRSLQLAFLKASVPDAEIPTDHAIVALLRSIAAKEGVPLIWGVNFSSESVLPRTWSQGHMDWAYIKKINHLFGTYKLKSFPHYSVWKIIYYRRLIRQKTFNLLNFIDYDKEAAKKQLIDDFGWKDYGGKHYESTYTKIFQSYILPFKFGFDKRKAHYSSLILAGQLTRAQAIKLLEEPPFQKEQIDKDINYLTKKVSNKQKRI
jgi:N-acetyl sugar amidotransferase